MRRCARFFLAVFPAATFRQRYTQRHARHADAQPERAEAQEDSTSSVPRTPENQAVETSGRTLAGEQQRQLRSEPVREDDTAALVEALMKLMERASSASGPATLANEFRLTRVLHFGDDLIFADLSGARTFLSWTRNMAPCWWTDLPIGGPADTPGAASVCVGVSGEGWLFVDLAQAPGAVAVCGEAEAQDDLLAELANRLSFLTRFDSGAVVVALAGQPFPDDLALGEFHRIPDVHHFEPAAFSPRTQLCFLFCAPSNREDIRRIEELSQEADIRVIPVVRGEVCPAEWAFVVHRATAAASW